MAENMNSEQQDHSQALASQVQQAFKDQQILAVQGNGSKAFLTHAVAGQTISTTAHQGIISYFPSELTITVRSGTLLSEVKQALADKGQMLAFEPPQFSPQATIGGTIAAGLSGPARPFYGSARDFVLGCRIINGQGDILQFGGEVMKNVAGYDLSRLICGSYGTLGILLDVSLKLLPLPVQQKTICFALDSEAFTKQIKDFLMAGHPLTAAAYTKGQVYIRLGGSEQGVDFAMQSIQKYMLEQQIQTREADNNFWTELNEQSLDFFKASQPLWRISLANITPEFSRNLLADDQFLIDWGGALVWLYSNQNSDNIRQFTQACGGHAQLFRSNNMTADREKSISRQQTLTPAMLKIHQQIKQAMDPQRILNPGCIYPEL